MVGPVGLVAYRGERQQERARDHDYGQKG